MTQLVKAPGIVKPRLELRTIVDSSELRGPRLAGKIGEFTRNVCALQSKCGQAACGFNVAVTPPDETYESSRFLEYGPVITLEPTAPTPACKFECVGYPPLQDELGKLRDGMVVADISRKAYVPSR